MGAVDAVTGGRLFEAKFKGQARNLFGDINLRQAFFSVGVDNDGDATGDWLLGSSDTTSEPITPGALRPDFVLTPPGAEPRSRKVRIDRESRSYLIGDFKLSLKSAANDYVGMNGRGPGNAPQWNTMSKYANKNAFWFVGIIALFGEGPARASYEKALMENAITSGKVGLLMFSILENGRSPF